jgi:hypothetical protein
MGCCGQTIERLQWAGLYYVAAILESQRAQFECAQCVFFSITDAPGASVETSILKDLSHGLLRYCGVFKQGGE